MNDSGTDPLEDQLSQLAARADEEIAAGRRRRGVTTMIAPPEFQPRLDKALACVELLRKFWNVEAPGSPEGQSPLPWRKLGRFEIRRELGRGGFGVVYLAHDPHLRREVALKVPRFDFGADPHLRQRFQNEAQAAASLDHPNIVQIYEAGEVGPVCYIASAYCPGQTLAAWLHERTEPIPAADAACLIATLADAVQHAHERGVLHRDLKPANVLMSGEWRMAGDGKTSLDASHPHASPAGTHHPPPATPKIADFGLSKQIAGSVESQVAQTQNGAILGTPQYMAPEQAEPKAGQVGPATDVYALGAIFYELLTDRPPFQADSVLELLVQVKSAEPLSPSKLRPRLPRDLETICLKCLEKDPRRRYARAALLAADLRRYMAHEPILARPISLPERCLKWTRRHPAIAGMAALTAVVALAGVAGILWQWRRAELEATNARSERDIALQERANAEENFRKAKEVVDQLTRVGRSLADQPGMHKTAQSLLEKSLGFYKEFLAKKSDDPVIRLETGRAYYRVADIYSSLERIPEAEAALAQGIALFDDLATQFPDRELYLSEKADGLEAQGDRLRRIKKPEQSLAAFNESIRCWRDLLARAPGNTYYKASLATTLLNRSAMRSGTAAEREAEIAEAIQLEEEVTAATAPNNSGYRFQLAAAYGELGLFLLEHDEKARARLELERALAIHQELYNAQPKNALYGSYLARGFGYLGHLQVASAERTQALESFRQAGKIAALLVADYPEFPTYRRDLGSYLNMVSGLLDQAEQRPERDALYREIIDHYARLMKQVPDDRDFVFKHGTHLILLARNLKRMDRATEGEKPFLAGIESRLKLAGEDPNNAQYQRSAGRDCAELSRWYQEQRRYKDADAILRRCVKLLPGNAEASNALAWFLVTCPDKNFLNPADAVSLAKAASTASRGEANIWNTLGVAYYRHGEFRESIRAIEEAIKLRKGGGPHDWLFLAMAHWQLGDKSQASEQYERALQWMNKNKSTDAELIRFREEAAELLGRS
jgi:serine/threonine protein kinase/Tfp pilus assembly protein PilF